VRAETRVARPCPLCGRSERKRLFERDSWTVVECAECSMVYIGEQMTYRSQIDEHDWLDDYQKEHSRRKQLHPALLLLSKYTRRLRPNTNDRLLSQTIRWARQGRLLDFGCGDASFIHRAAERFEISGIEISPRLAQASRQRVGAGKILEGPVTEIADQHVPAASFDVVTQFGYIEHEWNPMAGLGSAFRVLKPGGVTVIKTPNFASWNRRSMGLDWCGFHIPAHCNYFTPDTLADMLKRAGFEPLRRPLLDRLPTSDSLWMAARKPA
jgi:SAM-dependent methyltransferase